MRGIFLKWEMTIFSWLLDRPSLQGPAPAPPPSQAAGSGEGLGQSIHGGSNKQDERRESIFDNMGDTGGIIQGKNSAGH